MNATCHWFAFTSVVVFLFDDHWLEACRHCASAATRWRGWVVACSVLIGSRRVEESLPGPTLICLSFRAEEACHFFFLSFFFSHQGGAWRHTDVLQSGGWGTTQTVWSKIKTVRQHTSAMLTRHHATDWSPIGRSDQPPAGPAVPAAAPLSLSLSELQVRRLSEQLRSQECEDGLLQDLGGKFLSNTYCGKQTCLLCHFLKLVRNISRSCSSFLKTGLVDFEADTLQMHVFKKVKASV